MEPKGGREKLHAKIEKKVEGYSLGLLMRWSTNVPLSKDEVLAKIGSEIDKLEVRGK